MADSELNNDMSDNKTSRGSAFFELIKFALIIAIIVLPIRFYIAQPFIVRGASMEPTFENGDYLIIDEFTYNFLRDIKRGEVIVFRFPQDPSKFFIKRVIGLPGERVIITDGSVIIEKEGDRIRDPYPQPTHNRQMQEGVWQLEEDEYFVLGDNRAFSSDSRVWGVLPKSLITGRAILRLWPVTEVTYFSY